MNRAVLDKLLQHSYDNYQVLFNQYKFHNHNAHHLGSLYFLGASDERLEEIYKVMCDTVDPYDPSPHEITRANYRDSLGDKRFCKAYKDFFEHELMASGGNWREKCFDLLLDNKEQPLVNGIIISSVAHPLIHIGYAFELDSRIVAVEGLALNAVRYNELHKVIDTLKLPKSGSKSALEVFQDIHADKRFSTFAPLSVRVLPMVVQQSVDIAQFHYDNWKLDVDNLEKSVEELFDFSVYVYAATHQPGSAPLLLVCPKYILHLLTGMHAMRVIYPYLQDQQLVANLLSHFFYFACMIYIASNRPEINTKLVDDYQVDDDKNNWKYVIDRIVDTNLAKFRHLPKIAHSLKAGEAAYGVKNGLYLKAAVKTVDNLNGDDAWAGASDNPDFLISFKHK